MTYNRTQLTLPAWSPPHHAGQGRSPSRLPPSGHCPHVLGCHYTHCWLKLGILMASSLSLKVCSNSSHISEKHLGSLVYYRGYNSGRTKWWRSAGQASHVGGVLGFQALSGCSPSPAPRCVGNSALKTPSFGFFMVFLLSRRVWLKGACFCLFGCVGS